MTAKWSFIDEESNLFHYWLGWMISDGCIFIVSKNSAFINLGLHPSDIHILEFFKQQNRCTAKIMKQKNNNMRVSRTYLSPGYVDKLSKWGFIPNKTKNFKATNRLLNLNEQNFYQFLVGFIEGDGSVDHRKLTKKIKNKHYISASTRVRMIGVKNVLSFIKNKLEKFGYKERKLSPKKNNKAYEYTISGKEADHLIGNLMLSEYHLLDRKWSKSPLFSKLSNTSTSCSYHD